MGKVKSIPMDHLPAGNSCDHVLVSYYKLREDIVFKLIQSKFAGKKSDFAKDLGIAPETVVRWFMKKKGRRNIGEEIARRIEKKYSLRTGTLVMPEADVNEIAVRSGASADQLDEMRELAGRIEQILGELTAKRGKPEEPRSLQRPRSGSDSKPK